MLRYPTLFLGLSLLSVPAAARAEELPKAPDEAVAFITGASILLAGIGTGTMLIAGNGGLTQDTAGWLTMSSAFTVAPFVAHGIVGEWGRGLVFAAPPAVGLIGTTVVFGVEPDAVRHGDRIEQRWMWGFYTASLFTSAIGVVDAALAGGRARTLALVPHVAPGMAGLELRGTL